MAGWSCDEFTDFGDVQKAYIIFGYCAKSFQLIVFSILLFHILIQSCFSDKKIGKLSLLITVFCQLNAVFAITRIHATFPGQFEE